MLTVCIVQFQITVINQFHHYLKIKRFFSFSLSFPGVSFGDEITADSTEESAAVGSTVTLSCSYSSENTLQWYRQYPGSAPQFLVLIIESVKETKTSDVDPRFSTKLRKENQATKEIKHVDLIISSAAVSDSALYYCALRPTVTGNTSTLYKNLTQMYVYKFFLTGV